MFNAKDEILKLKNGESWVWPESDYGKAEIWLKYNTYFLFEIPIYGGGEPRFYKQFRDIDSLIKMVESWS